MTGLGVLVCAYTVATLLPWRRGRRRRGARVVVANGPPGKGSGSASGRRGAGSDRRDRRSGHGLAGMRERVQLTGGTLIAGPTGQGGWRVEARLPAPPPQDGRP